jgi:predicted oxidoreductase (fatty acid repression mutant protein)
MLQRSIKCSNSAFNAQGSRVIILVVQLGEVKIYVAAVEALGKKER